MEALEGPLVRVRNHHVVCIWEALQALQQERHCAEKQRLQRVLEIEPLLQMYGMYGMCHTTVNYDHHLAETKGKQNSHSSQAIYNTFLNG